MTAKVQIAAKACEGCGVEFERRRFPSGQLERASQFADRRFCSRECYRKAAADGGHKRVAGKWDPQPYGLFGPVSAIPMPTRRQASGSGYPWDRKQAASPLPISGPFQAERQTQFSEPSREEVP